MAELRPGDVLGWVDGDASESPEDVAGAIDDRRPGDDVEVAYERGGDRRTATVALAERPSETP